MRLLPPDLSSFIGAKLTSSKFSASPLNSAEIPSKSLILRKIGLPESADLTGLTNQNSLSKVPILESADVLLNSISPEQNQSAGQLAAFIQSLGLPQDTLSSSLISFFKFFSLPLDAQVLKQVRRGVLSSSGNLGKSADSAALAGSAAFDKGVSLSDDALKEYAAAIDPAERNNSHNNRSDQDSNAGSGFEQHHQDNHQNQHENDEKTPRKEDIRKLIDEIDAGSSLLGYLNKISGKNNQKWIVLPFNFTSGTVDFSVSLRILLNMKDDLHHSLERLAVDVVRNTLKNERRWFFLISKENNNSYNAQIAVNPALNKTEQTALLKELNEILGDFVANISFIDESVIELFPDSRNDSVISVDEEV